ncbi:hypothetical protein SprV_0100348200 [Sparganum proliferum]
MPGSPANIPHSGRPLRTSPDLLQKQSHNSTYCLLKRPDSHLFATPGASRTTIITNAICYRTPDDRAPQPTSSIPTMSSTPSTTPTMTITPSSASVTGEDTLETSSVTAFINSVPH